MNSLIFEFPSQLIDSRIPSHLVFCLSLWDDLLKLIGITDDSMILLQRLIVVDLEQSVDLQIDSISLGFQIPSFSDDYSEIFDFSMRLLPDLNVGNLQRLFQIFKIILNG
jgi:hypothetical protein